jgi:hypothetical protein
MSEYPQLGRQPHNDEAMIPLIQDLIHWKVIPPTAIPIRVNAAICRDLVQRVADTIIDVTSPDEET